MSHESRNLPWLILTFIIAFIKKNQLEDLYYMPQYGEASSYWVNEALKECALVGVGGFIVGLIIGKILKSERPSVFGFIIAIIAFMGWTP